MMLALLLITSRPGNIGVDLLNGGFLKDKDPSVPLFQYLVQAPRPDIFHRQNPFTSILLANPSE